MLGVDMRFACEHLDRMSKMIQIRNVPDEVHRRLKIRAAQEGMTLSDLLAREARELAERPTLAEMLERLTRAPAHRPLRPSAADIVRARRGE
jgi:plasmid stability protein